MLRYLDIIMAVSSIMLIRSGTEENLAKKRELWRYFKKCRRGDLPEAVSEYSGKRRESSGKRRKRFVCVHI